MVSQLRLYNFSCSTSADRALTLTYRCPDVAIPLPHHGRCLLRHLYPVHRPGRNLRSLTSQSLLTPLTHSTVPIIDNPSPTSRSRLRPTPSVLLPLSWLQFRPTLLEATIIHLLVFIVYYGLYRTDDNGSVSRSVVDPFLVLPFYLPPPPTFTSSLSLESPTTKSDTHPRSSTHPSSPCSHPLPFSFSQLYIFPLVSVSPVYI